MPTHAWVYVNKVSDLPKISDISQGSKLYGILSDSSYSETGWDPKDPPSVGYKIDLKVTTDKQEWLEEVKNLTIGARSPFRAVVIELKSFEVQINMKEG